MVTRSELQSTEQEIKSQWKGLITLTIILATPSLRSKEDAKPRYHQCSSVSSVVILGPNSEATNLCGALEAQGINAEVVQTLEEAAAITEKDGVRLALVDESFADAASTFGRLREHRTIPVVLLGASPEDDGWKKAANVEADAYLRKQMGLLEQVARIKAMLRRY